MAFPPLTPRPTKDEYWWLPLVFCLSFGFAGTGGALHVAMDDGKRAPSPLSASAEEYVEKEDAKERDIFMQDGSIGGIVGLALALVGMRIFRRLKNRNRL
jgi:hypothetical protein